MKQVRATGFNHVSISVDNLEEAVRFYSEILGMEKIPTFTLTSPAQFLRVGNLQLHLVQRRAPALEYHHFALTVDNFEAIYLKAEEAYTDSASFRKRYDYYLEEAIAEPVLSESVLKAYCHGSSAGPYRVEATLVPADEKSSNKPTFKSCSCPRGGFCKHLVALLLTWIHHTERFVVRLGLMGRLQEKSYEELLALLEQLLQRQPDVEPLVELLIELPLANAAQEENRPGRGRERTVDPSSIRSQVDTAFYDAGEGWDAASRAAPELEQLYEIGKSFAETGQWANAQVVYATLAEEAITQYEGLQDEGQISWVITRTRV